ncbi:MAG: mycofactocin biosynthesis glycosyltransferase MftF [Actinomycetota bacterium]|nr:mycofactocin biosynthesis glycosyltransferase MftF [Actinomycetota bacterium]
MLPPDFRVAFDPGVRELDGGTVLVGGSPLRLLRLTPAGVRLMDSLRSGEPVPQGGDAQRLVRRLLDGGLTHPRPAGSTFTRADVTIVVPVRDRPAELEATLACARDVAATIVVDDGSRTDATAAVGRRAGATVLRHDASLGPAAARNTGWRVATTPLVAFLDADCEPAPGWLDVLLAHFDDPQVAAVAARITSPDGSMLPATLRAYERAHPTLDRGPFEALVRPGSAVPFVPTAALVVRCAAMHAVGGFDERLRVGEDVDLVWRLGDAGWSVRYEPAAIATHPARPSATAWLRQRFDYGTSAAPLAARHGVAVAPLRVSPWTAVSWALIGAGAVPAGAAVAAVSTGLLAHRLHGGVRHPWHEAARLAGLGHLYGGRAVADAVRRAWWPIALVAARHSRRARRVAMAALLPLVLEWWQIRPAVDPVRWVSVRTADDVAYGAGVWVGCVRERSFAALRPELTNWPGQRPAVEPLATPRV